MDRVAARLSMIAFTLAVSQACTRLTAPSGSAAVAPGILVGAGDIAVCGHSGAELTARLLDRLPGTVFTAGDNTYSVGSEAEFQQCYEPTWGRHRSRTRPVPGNHDYGSANAAPYFAYFGANAGPAGRGYYSYDVGPWQVLALNSEIDVRPTSAQTQWIRSEMSSAPHACTLAIFHRPLFSSGPHGANPDVRDLFATLYDLGADVVITGHDHIYERFAPQDADGRLDPVRGIRQFVVGTGGAPRYEIARLSANSEVSGGGFGVLMMTLESGGYRWEFIAVDETGLRDAGSGRCH